MGDGRLAVFLIDRHFLALDGMAADRCIDSTLLLFHYTVYNAAVAPVHGMFLDLLRNKDMALIIFADNQ